MSEDRWWLNMTEAGRRLGVSYEIVRSMISAGQLHPIRLGTRRVIRVTEVEEILARWELDEVVER